MKDSDVVGDTPARHLQISLSEKTEFLNLEYIIAKFLEHQAVYMSTKIDVLEKMMLILHNLKDRKAIVNWLEEINTFMMEKPNFDIQPWGINNEKPDEVFNNKSCGNHFTIKSLKKELQNYVITIFDQYKLATENNMRLGQLYEEIISNQETLFSKSDDARHKHFGDHSKNRKLPNVEFCDNFDQIVLLPRKIRNIVQNLKKTYIRTENIDENTFNEMVIEQNYKYIFKTVAVEYTEDSKKGDQHYMGDQFVQYALAYCLRVFFQNQLDRRQNYVEQLLEGVVIQNMAAIWKDIEENPLSSYLDSTSQFNNSKGSIGVSHPSNYQKIGEDERLELELKD
jgi:hypothetical protein